MIVVTVARKPLSASNVAGNVIASGTGALNIDASRIAPVAGEVVGPGSFSNPANRTGEVGGDLGFTGNDTEKFQEAQAASVERANRLGRWPANLVLEHRPECRPAGTRRVKNQGGVPRTSEVVNTSVRFLGRQRTGFTHYFDNDGMEEVAAWECAPGCPVAGLDAQSGDVPTGSWVRHTDGAHPFGDAVGSPHEKWRTMEEPPGGASRFFKQVGGRR